MDQDQRSAVALKIAGVMPSSICPILATTLSALIACAPLNAQVETSQMLEARSTLTPASGKASDARSFEALFPRLRQEGTLPVSSEVGALSREGAVRLVLGVNDREVEAIAVSQNRLEELSSEVFSRINGESTTDASALNELRSRVGGQHIPSMRSDAVQRISGTISGVLLSARPESLQVNETFAVALERARLIGFRTDLAQLQLLPASSRLKEAANKNSALLSFTRRYEATIHALANVLVDPSDLTARQRAVAAATATFSTFVEDWPRLKGSWEGRRLAIRALDGLARQSELKAVYGVRSNFLPASYRSIFLQSARTVVINDDQGQAICSGLAITSEWILTAGHCFVSRVPHNMSIQFSMDGTSLSAPLSVADVWPNPPKGSNSNDELDYAFVRVVPTTDITNGFSTLEQQIVAAGAPRPLCLRKRPGTYEEPVVVIAHLGPDKRVYDHAYVWYPHQVYDADFQKVAAMTGIRLHRLAEALFPDSRRNQESFYEDNLRSFEGAYQTQIGDGTQRRREYRWKSASAASKRPMFGFDTDTRHGNSGAPVFSRVDHCVLGVFGGGRPDGVSISEASWKEHEFATPIMSLLADMEREALDISINPDGEVQAKRSGLVQVLRAASR